MATPAGPLAPPTIASPDNGPWQVDVWREGKVVLQSDDFEHDVALIVDGDFACPEDKLAYANALAAWMNAKLPATPRHTG